MKTNDLREVIQDKLEILKAKYEIDDVFYMYAKTDAMYPHIIFSFNRMDMLDFNRKDYMVDIDIYTKNQALAFDIADDVEKIFIFSNDPQDTILPTFYAEDRVDVEDNDKSIRHIVVRMQAQLYINE